MIARCRINVTVLRSTLKTWTLSVACITNPLPVIPEDIISCLTEKINLDEV